MTIRPHRLLVLGDRLDFPCQCSYRTFVTKLRTFPIMESKCQKTDKILILNYRIYCNKRPLPINRPPLPSSLPLQSSYFGVLHLSQQPTPLRFRDSEKWCILVLAKRISLTRNNENKNETWQFWSQTHGNLQKYEIKLHNFFRFKVCFKYFKLSRHYTC